MPKKQQKTRHAEEADTDEASTSHQEIPHITESEDSEDSSAFEDFVEGRDRNFEM